MPGKHPGKKEIKTGGNPATGKGRGAEMGSTNP